MHHCLTNISRKQWNSAHSECRDSNRDLQIPFFTDHTANLIQICRPRHRKDHTGHSKQNQFKDRMIRSMKYHSIIARCFPRKCTYTDSKQNKPNLRHGRICKKFLHIGRKDSTCPSDKHCTECQNHKRDIPRAICLKQSNCNQHSAINSGF